MGIFKENCTRASLESSSARVSREPGEIQMGNKNTRSGKMKMIDFEAHFYTQACVDYLKKRTCAPCLSKTATPGTYNLQFTNQVSLEHNEEILGRLLDIGEERVAWMDQNGLDMQILSLDVPSGVESFDYQDATALARDSNDELATAIKKYPTRFRGFAAIAQSNVKEGVKELERCIKQLGFVGWLTHSNYGPNHYLDDKEFWPLLEAAEALNVPIFLHPSVPEIAQFEKYGFASAGNALGFQFDAALCLMRMILGGVFDQFPKLKIILGHLGETMPFLMERLDFLYKHPQFANGRPNIKKWPSHVLCENVYVGTSGRFYKPALEFVIKAMGPEKMLFASDYPYESLPETMAFIKNADLPVNTLKKLAYENAKIFGIE